LPAHSWSDYVSVVQPRGATGRAPPLAHFSRRGGNEKAPRCGAFAVIFSDAVFTEAMVDPEDGRCGVRGHEDLESERADASNYFRRFAQRL
jgi:hypothetical protein